MRFFRLFSSSSSVLWRFRSLPSSTVVSATATKAGSGSFDGSLCGSGRSVFSVLLTLDVVVTAVPSLSLGEFSSAGGGLVWGVADFPFSFSLDLLQRKHSLFEQLIFFHLTESLLNIVCYFIPSVLTMATRPLRLFRHLNVALTYFVKK